MQAAPAPQQEIVDEQIEEEEVLLAVPPPPMESLAQIIHTPPKARPQMPLVKSINAKQTIVPVFLTVGFFLIVGAVLKYVVGEDSPMHDLPGWVPPLLIVLGLASWGVAAANMLSIRAMLAQQQDGLQP